MMFSIKLDDALLKANHKSQLAKAELARTELKEIKSYLKIIASSEFGR